ncbi:unnamed protein product [Eruca vesicaria subsp. sativa]|uniref:NYN domain-containing protein n=1 Tax=Eruca vesicaria subsp. sativa TaxID=29727 RepID=A0ABC8KWH5_ERUVS|nr:unnamed protein product [Eruca vesicaria subsp. sativa]
MHADGWTGVFWDMDEFPLPPGLDVKQFVNNVKLAIWSEGFRGPEVDFFAYTSSDSFNYSDDEFFTLFKVEDKRSGFYRLLHGMLNWLYKRQQYGGTKSLLFIAKAMPGEDNDTMISILNSLLVRSHCVLTVVPDGCSPENFDYPEPTLAWYWSDLCSGNKSIELPDPTFSDDDSGSSSPETHRAD